MFWMRAVTQWVHILKIVKKRSNGYIASCPFAKSQESEEAELTRNLNIIKRNVGVSVGGLVPGDPSPYLAEKGERVYKAMVAIRKCVSSSSDAILNANCREICESGVLQCMVVLLGNEAADKYPRLELETAWVCTNLASGLSEFCVSLVQSGKPLSPLYCPYSPSLSLLSLYPLMVII